MTVAQILLAMQVICSVAALIIIGIKVAPSIARRVDAMRREHAHH